MSHHPIKVLEDGTRVYSNHTRYTPVPDHLRTYKRRKPQEPGYVLWQGKWWGPLVLAADEARVLPETRPDTDAYEHMTKPRKCMCFVCRRPESEQWKAKWRKDLRLSQGTPAELASLGE